MANETFTSYEISYRGGIVWKPYPLELRLPNTLYIQTYADFSLTDANGEGFHFDNSFGVRCWPYPDNFLVDIVNYEIEWTKSNHNLRIWGGDAIALQKAILESIYISASKHHKSAEEHIAITNSFTNGILLRDLTPIFYRTLAPNTKIPKNGYSF